MKTDYPDWLPTVVMTAAVLIPFCLGYWFQVVFLPWIGWATPACG